MTEPVSTRPLVTMFESYGSGAEQVGPAVAERLGVSWIGQGHTTEELEAADPKGTGRINLKSFYGALPFLDIGSLDLIEDPMTVRAREQAVLVHDLAKDGGVILGRNATVILSQVPGALHVKLDGPRDARISRAARAGGISVDQAALRQRREDTVRAEMSLALWHWDPRQSEQFDIVINTYTLGIEAAVDLIVQLSEQRRAALTG